MTKKRGPWTIKESVQKYRHSLMEVYEDQVIRPNGKPGTYATVKIKAGVSVLPVDTEGFVYLVKGFRYAVGRESIEAVSGAIDDGEQPIDAAKRELREELGIGAGVLVELGQLDPITSVIDSPSNLFLATDLKFEEKVQAGSSEIFETIKVTLGEAVRMALEGKITHGSSCIVILRADHYLKK